VRVMVLGQIEVERDGRIIRPAGRHQRALLAALALQQGKIVMVDQLVDAIWDIRPPRTARAKIHTNVSGLRHALGQSAPKVDGPVVTGASGYALSQNGVELDLAEFESLSRRGRRASLSGQSDVVSRLFGDALALWRGPALADVTSPSLRAAAEVLEEQRLLATEAKAEADLALGRADTVVAELLSVLAAHPFRERLRGLLMLAFYQIGCRTDALALYRDAHRMMTAELGLEPGQQLRELHQRILVADSAPRRAPRAH